MARAIQKKGCSMKFRVRAILRGHFGDHKNYFGPIRLVAARHKVLSARIVEGRAAYHHNLPTIDLVGRSRNGASRTAVVAALRRVVVPMTQSLPLVRDEFAVAIEVNGKSISLEPARR